MATCVFCQYFKLFQAVKRATIYGDQQYSMQCRVAATDRITRFKMELPHKQKRFAKPQVYRFSLKELLTCKC